MKPTPSLVRGFHALGVSLLSFWLFQATQAANTWDGGGSPDGKWGTVANWDNDTLPAFPAALTFGGTTQLATDNDQTGITVNGITYSSGAGAFTIAGNAISLGGDIVNSSTSTQRINLAMAMTAARTFDAASGDLAVGGAISGAFAFTKIGAGTMTVSGANSNSGAVINVGTLKLGASNTLSSTGTIIFGSTGTLDLAGFTQTTGTFNPANTGALNVGAVTSSAAGGNLTINTGNTNNGAFSQTSFTNGTGTLALTILGSNPGGNVQIQNTGNTFSGGLTIKSSNAGSLTTANLLAAGGLTGHTLQGVRSASAVAIGSAPISLDNGQLFFTAGVNVANSINISARGGVLHMEGSGANATGGFTGTINNAGALVMVNSNSGNSNIVKLGNVSGFTGTLAIDTTNIGGVAFNETSLGNSNMNLLWFGNNTAISNHGTGRVQYRGTGDATLTFGEFNNSNSGAVDLGFTGAVENTVAATTATFAIGNSNVTPATFQGVIRNGPGGTVALTKNGTNTQILTGNNSYTGATTINGGSLRVNGGLASGSAVTVNTGGNLTSNGAVAGSVSVLAGGSLGGVGSISGAVTLANGAGTGNQATISLVDGAAGNLSLLNSAELVLGGTAGNIVNLNMEAGPSSTSDSISLSGDLNVGAGGAVITISSLGVAAGKTYDLITFPNGIGKGAGFTIGSGTTVSGLTLANPSLGFGVSGTLNVTANSVQLVTTGAASPTSAYWSGSKGSTWISNTSGQGNFTTTAAGGAFVSSLPGSETNVFFSNNSASNLTNTLGGNFAIGSLTFRGTSAAASISGANQLSIDSGGITVESGNGGATLGMSTLTLSNFQTWTNNSTNPLTVTAAVNGGFNDLTLAGNSIKLGGSSLSTTGGLIVNASLDAAGTNIASGDLNGSGSISNTGIPATIGASVLNDSVFSGTISDGGSGSALSMTKGGSSSLTLSGTNSYSGATVVNSGTLVLGNASALGAVGSVVSGSGTTVANSAALDLNGQTISEGLSITGTGPAPTGALFNSNTSSPAVVNSELINNPSFTVGGSGDITLQRIQTTNATVTKNGSGTLTLGTPSATGHNNLLTLVANEGTVVLNMPGLLSVDRGLTINTGATVRLAGTAANGGQIQDDNTVAINQGTFDMNGRSEVVGALNGAASTTITNTAATTVSTLSVGGTGTLNATGTFAGVINDGAGQTALTKTGLGTQTITGAQSYTGDTRVNSGILSLDTAYLADTASVYIATNGQLNLTHSGTDIVNALYINNVAQVNGVYDSTNTGGHITGTGKIQVGAVAPGYAAWATANGIPGEPASGDFDHDGITNLMEYALAGFNPTQSNGSPGTLTGKVLSFAKRAEAVTNNDVTYSIEESTTLGAAPDPWATAAPITEDSSSISWTLPAGLPKQFARLIVKQN